MKPFCISPPFLLLARPHTHYRPHQFIFHQQPYRNPSESHFNIEINHSWNIANNREQKLVTIFNFLHTKAQYLKFIFNLLLVWPPLGLFAIKSNSYSKAFIYYSAKHAYYVKSIHLSLSEQFDLKYPKLNLLINLVKYDWYPHTRCLSYHASSLADKRKQQNDPFLVFSGIPNSINEFV